jgi:hypothetical protein
MRMLNEARWHALVRGMQFPRGGLQVLARDARVGARGGNEQTVREGGMLH